MIAEVFIEGEVLASKLSLKLMMLASSPRHEQSLSGQVESIVYSGCKNPCNPVYRSSITEAGLKVGKSLVAHGVSVDISQWTS